MTTNEIQKLSNEEEELVNKAKALEDKVNSTARTFAEAGGPPRTQGNDALIEQTNNILLLQKLLRRIEKMGIKYP